MHRARFGKSLVRFLSSMAIRKHTFTICGRKYTQDVADEYEEIYRMAERRLNADLLEREKNYTDGCDNRDYLALSALDFVAELICLESDNEGQTDLEPLNALIEKIESRLK